MDDDNHNGQNGLATAEEQLVPTSEVEESSPTDMLPTAPNKGRRLSYIMMLTLFSAIGGCLFGYDTGVVSGAMIKVDKVFSLTHLWHELIVSVTVGAAAVAALIGGPLSDLLGRRMVLIVSSVIFTLGAVLLAASVAKEMLLVGRLVVGVGIDRSKESVRHHILAASSLVGYPKLKEEQLNAITELLRGRDTFVTLPTGYGKSLVYQILPVCAKNVFMGDHDPPDVFPIVIVLSPLVSLMADQAKRLSDLGISSIYLSPELIDKQTRRITDGTVSIIFSSPESLLQITGGRNLLTSEFMQKNTIAVAIDEAHCIVKWYVSLHHDHVLQTITYIAWSSYYRGMGSVFRAWYGEVAQLRSLLPRGVPFVALTATSTTLVRRIIMDQLLMEDVALIETSPERVNIRYAIVKASRDLQLSFQWLIDRLKTDKSRTDKTIIFCRTIHTCSSLFNIFLYELREEAYHPLGSKKSIPTRLFAMYHAKVDSDDKLEILESFRKQEGTIRVLFSTVAFGMGVDISNIRLVIHYGPAADVDDYFQESGRAGRDGLSSTAILYLYPGCLLGNVSKDMKEYCQATKCRRLALLSYFGHRQTIFDESSMHKCCDVCQQHCKCSGDNCTYSCDVAEKPLEV